MSGCNNKLKHTCGTKLNSRCTFYDGYIPSDSDLINEECVTIEETTIDLYNITDSIKENIDLTELGNECLDYEEEETGVIKVKEALITFEREICLLKESDSNSGCCIDINNLDTACLEDECDVNFSNPESLIQALITKVCALEDIINNLTSTDSPVAVPNL